MREGAEIVKILREEEKLGTLSSKISSGYETVELPEKTEGGKLSEQTLEHYDGKLNEIKLGDFEQKYRTIFENYAVAITLADENEQIVSWNKYAEELLNLDEKDMFMKHVSELYPKEEWKKIRDENIRQKGMRNKLETKMIRKGGGFICVEISLCVLKGAKGKTMGSVGIIRDITKLKTTEKKLVESEEKYKTIFENSAVAIMLTDENENIVSWNSYAENMLGFDKEDLHMKPVSSLYQTKEWKKIRSENVRQKGMQHHLETKILKKNNELLDVDMSLSVLKDFDGNVVGSIGIIKDISERKKTEKELAYQHGLLQSLLDAVPDSIYFKDTDSKFVKVNKAKAMHSNTTPENMIGKTDFDFLPENDAKRIYKDDQKVMKTGKSLVNKTEKYVNKDGDERWISVTKIPRYNQDRETIGTMGISRNITELKKSEKRYRDLFETAMDPIIIFDTEGNFVDINKKVTELLGHSKKDLIGKRFDSVEILTKESRIKALEMFKKRMSGKNVSTYEVEILTKKGKKIHVEINANAIYSDGKLVGDLVILRDLKERYQREKIENELLKSEKKFRDIFDATSDFLVYVDVKGTILDMNGTAVKMGSLEKEKVINKPFSSIKGLFPKKDMKRHLESVEMAAKDIVVSDYESDLISKDGVKYRLLFSTDLIKEKKEIKGILIRGRDVTQRQRAWEELVKLEEKYRVLAETSADGVITIDPLGRLTYVNPSFEKLCGKRKSRILATLFRDYLLDDSVYFFQQIFIDARKQNETIENVELELINEIRGAIPIEVNIAPLKKDKEFAGMVCTVRDITQRRRMEDELKKSERLKTEFMNIAAHELKSPVTPVKGYLDLIISDENASEQVKNWAKISLRNAERLLKLVNDILDVSRLDSDTMRFDMEKLDTVEILEEIVEDMKSTIERKNLQFITKIPKNLPAIVGDKYRLSQVLKNLLVNAVKFTDHGSITVGARKKEDYIVIWVEDTGVGVSESELKKIFTKFYQAYTGEDRKNEGTGLGLFICKEIIEKHNGKIWAESKLRKGSKLLIQLPYIHKMTVGFKS